MEPITPRVGRRPVTSREEIVDRALELLDANGVGGFTMRELAAEIGVTPMALYRHVGDKEHLLSLALDAAAAPLAGLEFPADPRLRILEAMTVTYDTLVGRPWVPEALTGPQRIGRGALRITDAVLGAAEELCGDRHAAVRAYRAIWSLTLGSVLSRNRQRVERALDSESRWLTDLLAEQPPDAAPHFRASLADPTPAPSRDDFRNALSALVDGLFGAGPET